MKCTATTAEILVENRDKLSKKNEDGDRTKYFRTE